MSELNPDFRDDHPDIDDVREVHRWLEDASIDDAERARRADTIATLEAGRSGDNRPEIAEAVGRARGQGVGSTPAPGEGEPSGSGGQASAAGRDKGSDDTRSSSSKDKGSSKRA